MSLAYAAREYSQHAAVLPFAIQLNDLKSIEYDWIWKRSSTMMDLLFRKRSIGKEKLIKAVLCSYVIEYK